MPPRPAKQHVSLRKNWNISFDRETAGILKDAIVHQSSVHTRKRLFEKAAHLLAKQSRWEGMVQRVERQAHERRQLAIARIAIKRGLEACGLSAKIAAQKMTDRQRAVLREKIFRRIGVRGDRRMPRNLPFTPRQWGVFWRVYTYTMEKMVQTSHPIEGAITQSLSGIERPATYAVNRIMEEAIAIAHRRAQLLTLPVEEEKKIYIGETQRGIFTYAVESALNRAKIKSRALRLRIRNLELHKDPFGDGLGEEETPIEEIIKVKKKIGGAKYEKLELEIALTIGSLQGAFQIIDPKGNAFAQGKRPVAGTN